eukprot:301725_1
MSSQFQFSETIPDRLTQKSFKNQSFVEHSNEISAAPNRFPPSANEDESHDEIKTILDNEPEIKQRDEPQYSNERDKYSFHKVSSFGSLYRLSQVSLHSCYDNHNHNNGVIPRSRSLGNVQQMDQYIDVVSDADISCVGNKIVECIGLQRIISILLFYGNNCNNYDAINKYLDIYNMKKHLINDYIHILDKHLNEDNMLKHKSNRQFNIIYETMFDKSHLYCDITNCYIYQRNHRQRETQYITPLCDDYTTAMFVDILDAIHCYFIHSVDIGYRIIDKSIMHNDNPTSNNIYNAYDNDMKQLRKYLQMKQETLQQIRGHKLTYDSSRFTTQLLDDAASCNINAETDNNMSNMSNMEGYLQKESLYLKQLRLRYMVLSGDSLYSYKTNKKESLTETVDLKVYNHVEISQDGPVGQFELVNSNNKKKRVLVASSMQELDDWLKAFKQCIKPLIKSDNESDNESDTANQLDKFNKTVGERYDYWKHAIYPKYESIKEEVTNNKIFSISSDAFNAAYLKAKYLINASDKIRNMMTCSEVLDKYNFTYDTVIRIDHILALVLWTDYRQLSNEFRKTFTKISKKIYDEFWIWSKFLIEAVNAFGQRLKKAKVKTCYHNFKNMYNTSFQMTFNVPTSSTTKLQIAIMNAPKNGMILELGNNDQRFTKKMRYFNCSFISCFGNENERLFIQPPSNNYYFHILSIRNLETNENYCKYIYAINILHRLLTNQYTKSHISKNKVDIDRNCIEMINYLISIMYDRERGEKDRNVLELESKCPAYIKCILDEWRKNITNITFNSYINNKIVPDINIFNVDNIVRFDKLNVMFKNLKTIYIDCAKYVNINNWIDIVKILNNISKLKYSKLKEIYIIHREYGNKLKEIWDKISKLITDSNNKWQLIDVESKAVCITRAENI